MSMPLRGWVTDRTHDVFAKAHALAQRLGHDEVTPVHVTISILDEGTNVAALILLHSCRVPRDSVVRDLEAQLPASGNPLAAEHLAWSPSDEAMLARAAEEARELGHQHHGCEHLLLAFLRDPTVGPGVILARYGVDFARVQQDLVRIFDGSMLWQAGESDISGPAA